jgi:hypothetical protein
MSNSAIGSSRDVASAREGIRTQQCKACPWRVSTKPALDIPGGYSEARHRALARTIATPGVLHAGPVIAMACHESPVGAEQACVGWLAHQLGPGHNLALRMLACDGRFGDVRTDGPQHARFEDTLNVR